MLRVRISGIDGDPIDDGMVAVFFAPHSFTGEETVEFFCHGGKYVTTALLGELYRLGIRPAGPGEFTRRAFLNGKLGLSAAEGIADIIDAESREQLILAINQADGGLGREFEKLYDRLKSLVAEMYVRIDYPDADLPEDFTVNLDSLTSDVERLMRGYKTGRAIRDGVLTVICGTPNAGKSSLMNRLLGEERAIVTDIAGTTRDTIEERLTLGGVTLRLCDTAGLHATDDAVEKLGVERATARLGEAGLRLAVFDTSRSPSDDDAKLLDTLGESSSPTIVLFNKSDVEAFADEYRRLCGEKLGGATIIDVSAKTGDGIDALEAEIRRIFGADDVGTSLIVSNARQYAALTRTAEALSDARSALDVGQPDDIVGMLLEAAMSALAECDGREVSGDVVSEIFSRFCVGK